jgi:hypothetical protein
VVQPLHIYNKNEVLITKMKIMKHLLQIKRQIRLDIFYLLIFFLILVTIAVEYVYPETHTVIFSANDYSFEPYEDNSIIIKMDDFGILTEPGYPQLPSKIFFIDLPGNAEVTDVAIASSGTKILAGEFIIKEVQPLISNSADTLYINRCINRFKEIRDNVYQQNGFSPKFHSEYLGTNYRGKKPYVTIRFSPFAYNPVTKKLRFKHSINVKVSYRINQYRNFEQFNETIIINQAEEETDLLIIGSQTLKNDLSDFIFWKSCLDKSVQFVSTEWIYAEYIGIDKAEKIRNFLIDAFFTDSLKHVLFIGHTDVIPIKKLYPDPNNHGYSGGIPSDYYFSDLTGEWDSDNDGYAGEYGEDAIDWLPEINIGRIPWSDNAVVRDILQKSIQFEKEKNLWKEDALLIGGIINYKNENNYAHYIYQTDGASLMERLRNNIFNTNTTKTLYEKSGVNPSSFSCDLPINRDNIISSWAERKYGCVTWWLHGSYNSVSRKWWHIDDGNQIPEQRDIRWEQLLSTNYLPSDENYQPVIFANSCYNGWPEKISLGRELIKNSCVGIVASSRISWSILGWNDVKDGGNASLTYYFWDELIKENRTAGAALQQAKLSYLTNFNNSWYSLHNGYAYNYFGDPSLIFKGADPIFGGISGSVEYEDGLNDTVDSLLIEIAGSSFNTRTDENGWFQFTHIPGGNYIIQVSNDYKIVKEVDVLINNGEMTKVNIVLPNEKLPKIKWSDSSFVFTIQEDYSIQDILEVLNNSSDNLNLQCKYDNKKSSWLAIDSSKYIVKPGEKDSIYVTCNSINLDYGIYNSQFTMITNHSEDSILYFPVILNVIDTIPPNQIDDLVIQTIEEDLIDLSWSAPGDNDSTGQAERYEIWMSQESFVNSSFKNAYMICDSLYPDSAGIYEYESINYQNMSPSGWIIIKTLDETGLYSFSNEVSYNISDVVNNEANIPKDFICQNYPNPFNLSTTIDFSISKPSRVYVKIYNELGQMINELIDQNFQSGLNSVIWKGDDRFGCTVQSGIYFFKIETSNYCRIKKMLLIK